MRLKGGKCTTGSKPFWINPCQTNEKLKKCTFLPIPGLLTNLEKVIWENGGNVLRSDINAEYAILILDEKYYKDNPNENPKLPRDCFSSAFIYAYVKAAKEGKPPPNLNKFRLTVTNFPGEDVNQILRQEKKWGDFNLSEDATPYTQLTAQEVVTAWESRLDDEAHESSMSESMMEGNSQHSQVTHYKVTVEEGLNQFSVLFQASQTVRDVKKKFAHICEIPLSFQEWTGWPPNTPDEKLLSACNFPQTEISLKLSRLSPDENAGHSVNGNNSEQTPPNPTRPETNRQDSASSSLTSPRGRRIVTPARIPAVIPVQVVTGTPVQSDKAGPSKPVGPSPLQSRPPASPVPPTIPEQPMGASTSQSSQPVIALPVVTSPDNSPATSPIRPGLASPNRSPLVTSERLDEESPDVSPKRFRSRKRLIIESSPSSNATGSDVVVPRSPNLPSVPESSAKPQELIYMEIDSETDDERDYVPKQQQKSTRPENSSVTAEVKKPLPVKGSLTVKQVNCSNKKGNDVAVTKSVPDSVQKEPPADRQRKHRSVSISEFSDSEKDEDDFRKRKQATSTSTKEVDGASPAKVSKLVPIAVAGPNGKKPPAAKKPPAVRTVPAGSGSELEDISDPEDKGESKDEKLEIKPPRRDYTIEEGQKILNVLCYYKAFLYTGGNQLWRQLSHSNLFPGRTFSSLRDHYLKKVKKLVLKEQLYKITKEDLEELKKADRRAQWTKNATFCPFFDFSQYQPIKKK